MVAGVADFSIKDILNALPDSKIIMSMVYHGDSNKGKKSRFGKPLKPTWWDVHCPDGLLLCMTDQLAAFLIATGGIAFLFVFWDALIAYLDEKGYRKMDSSMWQDLMSLGVLGGVSSDWKQLRDDTNAWLNKTKGEMDNNTEELKKKENRSLWEQWVLFQRKFWGRA